MSLAVGVDVGGTKTAAGLVSSSGEVVFRTEAPTPALEGPEAVLATIVRLAADAVAAATGEGAVIGAGIGAAGVIDPVRRVVVSATDTLPGWAGTELGAWAEDALGLPVAVENDVRAHAVGEARFGAGRGYGTVLAIAAGTGLGGAFVIDGAPLEGAASVAGHFGHMPSVEAQGLACTCGRSGHLEMIAAGPAVHAAYLRAGGAGHPADTRAVFQLAAGGDETATTVIAAAGRALGRAIGGLVNGLDPDIVIIAGGLSDTSETWWGPLRAGVAEETIDLVRDRQVVRAALGAEAAIIGAAALAFDTVRSGRHAAPASSATSGELL